MADKKENRPIRDNGTANTSDACNILCDYDNTVPLDFQEEFEELTYNGLLQGVTNEYLSGIDVDMIPSPAQLESQLLQATNNAIEAYNMGPRDPNTPPGAPLKEAYPNAKPMDERIRKQRALVPWQVAQIIKQLHHAKCVCWLNASDDGNYDIGIYQTNGDLQGIYDTLQDAFERLIRQYHATRLPAAILPRSLVFCVPNASM